MYIIQTSVISYFPHPSRRLSPSHMTCKKSISTQADALNDFTADNREKALPKTMSRLRRIKDAHQWVRILFFTTHLYNYIKIRRPMSQKTVIWVFLFLKRITGIEPASQAWEACILPMNYIRMFSFYNFNKNCQEYIRKCD
jgi:hypothetical protein